VIIFSCSRERDGNWRRSSRRLLELPPTWFLSCLSNKKGTIQPMIYVPGNLQKWNGVTLRAHCYSDGHRQKDIRVHMLLISPCQPHFTQRSFG
jgi:hypothetical protein